MTERTDPLETPMRRAPVRQRLAGYRAPWMDRAAEHVIRALATTAISAIILIFVFIGREAIPLFFEPDAQAQLGGLPSLVLPRAWQGYDEPAYVWQPVGASPVDGVTGKFNVVPLFVGTLKVTVLGMFIAVPIALLAAIFVSQYASRTAREVLKPAIELLASIPSVVLGFFALMILATLMRDWFGLTYRLNALVAGVALAIAIAPMVFTVAEDALSAVSKDLEAAALALGARKHQVVTRVVLPSASPGIAAAILLGLGRAIGETMIVLMASGNAAVIELFDPTSSARTVTATIASELGEVVVGGEHWRVLFLLGTVLFMITFVINRFAAWIVEILTKRLRAGGS